MEKIISGKRSRKTTFAIQALYKNTNNILVTVNSNESHRLREAYPDLKDRIFSRSEYIEIKQLGGSSKLQILIDPADYLMQVI